MDLIILPCSMARSECSRKPEDFLSPDTMCDERDEVVQHFTTNTVYITPKRAHWPVYDEAASNFVKAEQGEQRMSMCDLTLEEATSL